MPCMNPAFNPRLDLASNGQTIVARGPCSWHEDAESAEIRDVTGYQGASSRRTRGRPRCGRTVTGTGSSMPALLPLVGGRALASAMAAVRRTDGSAYEAPRGLPRLSSWSLRSRDMAICTPKGDPGQHSRRFQKGLCQIPPPCAPPYEPSSAPAYSRRRCRPPPNAGPGRRPCRHPERTAAQPIQPLHDLRQLKPVTDIVPPVAADARRRHGLLACRHPSRACPIEPPLSHRARNDDRLQDPHRACENRVPSVSQRPARRGLAVGPNSDRR